MAELDKDFLVKSLKNKQIQSFTELARRTGLHRNTINHYLSGNSVFQQGFEKICNSVAISPLDMVKKPKAKDRIHAIAPLIDLLHEKFPQMTFVLFGSRARGREKEFSDWDVGFYSTQPISHRQHLDMLKLKSEWLETSGLLVAVDLVNLNRADSDFLQACQDDFIFLTGKLKDWYALKEKAAL
jgi:predicted nucleotidyltransferase